MIRNSLLALLLFACPAHVRADEVDLGAALTARDGTYLAFGGASTIYEFGSQCRTAVVDDKGTLTIEGSNIFADGDASIGHCGTFICKGDARPATDIFRRADGQWVAEVTCGPGHGPTYHVGNYGNDRTPGCEGDAKPALRLNRFHGGWQAETFCPAPPCDKCEPTS